MSARTEELRALADIADEHERLLDEADEILGYAEKYLTEFGSVEPEYVYQRIRSWKIGLALAKAQQRELVQ
jgi:hypothetical protein